MNVFVVGILLPVAGSCMFILPLTITEPDKFGLSIIISIIYYKYSILVYYYKYVTKVFIFHPLVLVVKLNTALPADNATDDVTIVVEPISFVVTSVN